MTTIIPQKQCCKCKQFFPATTEYFSVVRREKGGLSYSCKVCNREYSRQLRKKNPELSRASDKRKYEKQKADPEKFSKLREQWRRRYEKNKDSHRLAAERYRRKNVGKCNAASRKSFHQRVGKEGTSFVAQRNHKRRARLLAAEGSHTKEELIQLFEDQEHRCGYCGITLYKHIPFDRYLDHIQPISRGGSNAIDNLVYTCQTCNQSKHDKTFEEWKAVRGW